MPEPAQFWLIAVLGGAVLVVALVLLWLMFGRGPRRARAYRRSQRLVRQGNWQPALQIVKTLQVGRLSKAWQGKLQNAEGECHRTAGVQAVQVKDFEKGLEHHLQAAQLLNINAAEVRASVVEKMLAEVRALFTSSSGKETEASQTMIQRVLRVQSPAACAEASFWQGLCHIREGKWEQAEQALRAARDAGAAGAAGSSIDPPLYLGGVLLRLGQAKEGLRFISEANRIDATCPLVALHLGIAIVAAGTDANLAIRALGRALGPGNRNLPAWLNEPARAWIDGLPQDRSFIRKLAVKEPFVCPLWGNDLRHLVRQGQLALGQAQYRLEQFDAAAEIFQKLLDDGAPTHDVLRWLGLALTRLERYQEAFKHLKTALDLENPKDRLTTGYLAICAACGKPDRQEDKGPNVAWGVRTVRQYTGLGDREWVSILMRVFGEALKLNMALSGDDHVFLCDHLLSVQAADREAAAAYHQVAVDYPDLLKPPYAWLYCRAAMQHPLDHEHCLDLFARTFQTQADARTYFAAHQWDFAELEYTYLKLAAIKAPGQFPAALGADYPQHGETMLLERSERLEKEQKPDAALASADVLLRLAPRSSRAHDRLAMLWHRRGKLDRAAEFLRSWSSVEPQNPVPWARLSVVQQQQGQLEQALQSLASALQCGTGRARADLACLAGRLVLATAFNSAQTEGGMESGTGPVGSGEPSHDALRQAQGYLHQCLQEHPDHAEALWLLAAIRTLLNDCQGLAELSSAMEGKQCADERYHYFAALSHLAAGRFDEVLGSAKRAENDPALTVEAAFVAGLAHRHRNDLAAAAASLRTVTQHQDSPSAGHARAIYGALRFQQGEIADAIQAWQGLDAPRRTAWQLTAPLQQSLLLAGFQELGNSQFEQAAERFRAAGSAGLRDPRLGRWIQYALVKAGQRLLYHNPHANGQPRDGTRLVEAARLFDQASKFGQADANLAYMQAMAGKRQGKLAEAAAALRKIADPDSNVVLQVGLLSMQDHQFAQAEQDFARSWQLDPTSYAAGYNLMLAQLSQGKIEPCVPLIGQLKPLAATPDERQFLTLLEPLLQCCTETTGGKPPPVPGLASPDMLANMSAADEERLLQILLGLGHTEAVLPLLRGLAVARPDSQATQEAFATAVLLQAHQQVRRCHWEAAEKLLTPIASSFTTGSRACRNIARGLQVATYNTLGNCQCMLQEFDRAIDYFSWAIKLTPSDPWLHQNLALAWELKGQLDQADSHWNRYFELQARVPAPHPTWGASYHDKLAYEGLSRLADAFSKKDRWNTALTYLQRACRLRPGDFDAHERLFHMYNQVKRPEDARRTLKRLREMRPNDPQMELYELDLREVKTLDDVEHMLGDIRKTLSKFPGDMRVEEKAVAMVGNVIPLIGRMCDQCTDQLTRVMEQVRRLPNYQINWSAVHDVMRDLQREFQKLRRIANKCLSLVTSEEHRRIIRELLDHIDRKVEVCQSMGA